MREITFVIEKKTVTRNFQYEENREFKRFGVQIDLFGYFIFSYRASQKSTQRKMATKKSSFVWLIQLNGNSIYYPMNNAN